MSYAASYWGKLHPTSHMLHSTELSCTFLSELRCTLSELHCALRDRRTLWAKLHPFELRCTLLSYAAPFWTTLHPSELRLTLKNMMSPATPIAALLFLQVKLIILFIEKTPRKFQIGKNSLKYTTSHIVHYATCRWHWNLQYIKINYGKTKT